MGPIIEAAEVGRRLEELRVIDARVDQAAYERSHVEGAVWADLESDLSAPTGDARRGGRHPLPAIDAWARTLGGWGIDPGTPVVVYDDRGGALAAARVWWMLRASGHREVAVVDGGWAALRIAGVPTDAASPPHDPRPPYPVDAWQLPLVSRERVETLRQSSEHRLLDVRAAERFAGDSEPIDPVAGHIEGAINVPFAENLDADGHFRDAAELRALYTERLGDVPPEQAVVQCGSGVTACHTLLALEHAGLGGAALYVGSWSEWCLRRSHESGLARKS